MRQLDDHRLAAREGALLPVDRRCRAGRRRGSSSASRRSARSAAGAGSARGRGRAAPRSMAGGTRSRAAGGSRRRGRGRRATRAPRTRPGRGCSRCRASRLPRRGPGKLRFRSTPWALTRRLAERPSGLTVSITQRSTPVRSRERRASARPSPAARRLVAVDDADDQRLVRDSRVAEPHRLDLAALHRLSRASRPARSAAAAAPPGSPWRRRPPPARRRARQPAPVCSHQWKAREKPAFEAQSTSGEGSTPKKTVAAAQSDRGAPDQRAAAGALAVGLRARRRRSRRHPALSARPTPGREAEEVAADVIQTAATTRR